jgi:hypothetical protein
MDRNTMNVTGIYPSVINSYILTMTYSKSAETTQAAFPSPLSKAFSRTKSPILCKSDEVNFTAEASS